MKIIFLDVDGVLNCRNSTSKCQCFIGIDADKVKRLRRIVEVTGAKIVLTSTWKLHWIRDLRYKDEQNELSNYLDRKLRRENLFISDKTTEDNLKHRGQGIYDYLSRHQVESWVVLDDEIFDDYEYYGVMSHLVKTSFYADNGGLQDEHVELAIGLLNTIQND